MRTRRLLALALAVSFTASCADAGDGAAPATAPPPAAPAEPGDRDPAGTNPPPPSTAPTTTAPAPLAAELPAVPVPFGLTGSPAEQADAIVTALGDPGADRTAIALAAFDAAGLPVLLADGTSLTDAADPIGLPWSLVGSGVALADSDARVSLTELTRLLSMVDPAAEFDVAAAADATAAAMRAELASPAATGPSLVASLVAAESHAYDGTDLADPSVTADQLHVGMTTAMLIGAGVMRASAALILQSTDAAGSSDADADSAAPSGYAGVRAGFRSAPRAPSQSDITNGCDDGVGGWGLWLASKVATGLTFGPQLGIEWTGLYDELARLGAARGLGSDLAGATHTANKMSAVAFAAVNAAAFLAQIAGRTATATMDGDGPLVRTKQADADGAARQVTLEIRYDAGDPEIANQRNCILAALAAVGNNAQLATGPAKGVIVGTQGAIGFADGLAVGDSFVMFGPATFQIEQTADDNGRITVPVQGRRQKTDKTEATTEIFKQFSIFFEAALDPTEASQIARAFADDALCLGEVSTGQMTTALAECQNALINIMKQFRWDIGEFAFPLQDWESGGWEVVDGVLGPYELTGIKCDGIGGLWFLNLTGTYESASFDAVLEGEMDEATGTGSFSVSGVAEGGGVSVPVGGTGTMAFVQTGADTAQLVIEPTDGGGEVGGGTLQLVRTSCE